MGGSSGGSYAPPARLPNPPGTVPTGQTAQANPGYQAYSFLPTSNVPVSGFSPGMWDMLNAMPGIPESDKPAKPNIPKKTTAAAPTKKAATPAKDTAQYGNPFFKDDQWHVSRNGQNVTIDPAAYHAGKGYVPLGGGSWPAGDGGGAAGGRSQLASTIARGRSPTTGRRLSSDEWGRYHGGGNSR